MPKISTPPGNITIKTPYLIFQDISDNTLFLDKSNAHKILYTFDFNLLSSNLLANSITLSPGSSIDIDADSVTTVSCTGDQSAKNCTIEKGNYSIFLMVNGKFYESGHESSILEKYKLLKEVGICN